MAETATFLNSRRQRYALIAGAATWFAWLLSILLGEGRFDLAGAVIGADYLQFYAAGSALRMGESARLYDPSFMHALEMTIAGSEKTSYYAFITPPFLAWLFVPLSLLPYELSFAVWSAGGLLLLWLALRGLGLDWKALPWALSFFPVFAAISFGQNSLITLALFVFGYTKLRKGNLIVAGAIVSLTLYKPQLAFGIGLLWLLGWRRDWKALAGLLAGGAGLAAFSFLFTPQASLDYLTLSRSAFSQMLSMEGFPIWHAHTLRAFWVLLLPGLATLAEVLALLCALPAIVGFIAVWRKNRANPPLLFAAAVLLTIWVTPHAMIYDWAILLIPAVLLWQSSPAQRPQLLPLFALVWGAAFLSGPLTVMQLKILPVALQISLPALGWCVYRIFSGLGHAETGE